MPRIIDMFCGAGGSSLGASWTGAEIELALNHWKVAVETHAVNFPNAKHDCCDIQTTDPRRYPRTEILLASPECTNHSIAKGARRRHQRQIELFGTAEIDPVAERSRATMWDVVRFTEYHKFDYVIVENVVDVRMWALWQSWIHAMSNLGYRHKEVYLNSQFAHPTPQSRDRIYVVFWKKGMRAPNLDFNPAAWCGRCERNVESVQAWRPERSWGKYERQYHYCCPQCGNKVRPYYYAAANAIDWTLPCPRIGDRTKPLQPKTIERIKYGLRKYTRPIVIGAHRNGASVHSTEDPLTTVIAGRSNHYLCNPFLIDTCYTHAPASRVTDCLDPLPTQTARQERGLAVPPGSVTPFLLDNRNTFPVHGTDRPLSTITAIPQTYLLSYYQGGGQDHPLTDPIPTIPTIDRHAVVNLPNAFLSRQYSGHDHSLPITSTFGAITTQDHHSLIEVEDGHLPAVEDCGYRMLQPHELKAGMGFPDDYVILGAKRAQTRQIGNAVTPPVMRNIVSRCLEAY